MKIDFSIDYTHYTMLLFFLQVPCVGVGTITTKSGKQMMIFSAKSL